MSAGYELAVERTLDAPLAAVWTAVTEHIAEWWCPRPWSTEVEALEWRTGGPFALTMRSPDGEAHAGDGVLLDFAPRERIVFTNMLTRDLAPQDPQPLGIVGRFEFADAGEGRTRYRASSLHWSEADKQRHAEMGFEQGWGAVADQLEEVAKGIAER